MDASVHPQTPSGIVGLGQLLPCLARRWGAKTALVTESRSMSFAELDNESSRVAVGLAARGVSAGDRVSLLAQNRWEWIVSYHAVLKLGAVVNPLNVMLTGAEVAYILQDAGSVALLASGDRLESVAAHLQGVDSLRLLVGFDDSTAAATPFAELLAASTEGFVPAEVDPGSLACIGYTSGTTGHPKGAMQSQRSLVYNSAYTATMHGRDDRDVMVTALPAPHVYGNVAINGTFMAGGTVVLMSRFDATRALQLIGEYRATLFEGVPAMYAMMLASPEIDAVDLSSLTRSTVGGQTIAASIEGQWERLSGAPLIELWGMTEISGLGTTHSRHAPNLHGSIGVALPGVAVKVAPFDDPAGECGPGDAGELMVKGPIVMMGYFNNPEATAQTVEPDGWLHTGDIATHDGDGHFFVVDRLKDMIVTAGYNIYPAEIERVMIGHDAVAMVAVGRAPDDVKGEVAHAYVVLAPGAAADADSLLTHAREHLAAYKVPRAVHFVDDLPKTSSGKIMRRMLTPPLATSAL